ncbi:MULTISPECIES: hypothetical protein [unclassified Haladaptatus]|uniref:hypothetical protein n=1 Tax=unclassified Haladaptatus TaxID=2622732 RepID=UPI0023E7A3CD|nr:MULTISPECIES: hypothetical protein [unclassified Haladaptatus]
MSEQSARSSARWAIREGAIIGGILGFWLVLQAATATVALYTLVRVGMLIIDHWRKTSPQVQGA